MDYEDSQRRRLGLVEIWRYERPRLGLDRQAPKNAYYFIQDGDLTRFAEGSELPRVLP